MQGNCWSFFFVTNNSTARLYNSQVWNMGYCWSREVNFFIFPVYAWFIVQTIRRTQLYVIFSQYPPFFLVSTTNTSWGKILLLIMYFRYAALAPLYYRGAAVAVIVYDITSPESFSKAQYWVKVVLQLLHGSILSFLICCRHLNDMNNKWFTWLFSGTGTVQWWIEYNPILIKFLCLYFIVIVIK